MKIANFLFALIFMAFAFTKIEDPRPIAGILMFGAMAVICIMAMFKVYYKWFIIAMVVPVLYYAASVHLDTRQWVHSGGAVNHEEAVFFFQLAFSAIVLLFQCLRSFRKA